jgi:uncharacterized delta-60 repeat protein
MPLLSGEYGGVVQTWKRGDSETAYALALAPDGKILGGGDSNHGSTTTGLDFALARYNPDGSPDVTFGSGGKVTTSMGAGGGRDSIYGLTLEDMGGDLRILAVGGEGDFAMARYLADGQLDVAFGAGGKLTGVFGSTIGAARGVKVAPDGKIVVAGHAQHDFALARFTSGGQLDAGFTVGGTGMVLTEIAAKTKADQATAVLLQTDDRVPTVRLLVAATPAARTATSRSPATGASRLGGGA